MRQMPLPSRVAMSVIEQGLLGLTFLALIVLSSLPAARTASPAFGWTPLWLLALPAVALATAFVLRLSRHHAPGASQSRAPRRRQAAWMPASQRRGAESAALRNRMPRAA